jgi:hypothetical protein
MSKAFAWSFSALNSFETCPLRYKLTRITKQAQEVQTKESLWGNRVHKAFENKLKHRTPFPAEAREFEHVAESILKGAQGAKLTAEGKLAITANFKLTTYFAPDVWLRVVTDFQVERKDRLVVGDFKTGKKKPDSTQLALSAATLFATKPYIQHITSCFLWLKDGTTTTERYTRDEAADIWQEFMPRVKRMEEAIKADKMPPRPSGLCRNYCPVGKRLCDHCGTN